MSLKGVLPFTILFHIGAAERLAGCGVSSNENID
jgi:hypothetical protein